MQIGAYQVLFELARGGMGTVYLARARGIAGFERLVAIKRAHPALSDTHSPTDRFMDEARVAALVHHANVVGMHQAGHDEQGYYFVCDYVEGESLDGLVKRAARLRGRVPLPIVMRVALDGLAGLHAVHQACDPSGAPLGILHRDVSIQNLLVGRDGVTRLTDFGVAKSALSSVITDQHYVQGKLIYMAPEYLSRQPVDQTLDIYAMGITLFTALAGAHPWNGKDQVEILQAIQHSGVPMLSTTGTVVPPTIEAVILKACASEREQRFQSAREMLDELEAASVDAGVLARHVEVAEYVERMVGDELSARREAIKACSEATRSSISAAEPIVSSSAMQAASAGSLAASKESPRVRSQTEFTLEEVPISERPRRKGVMRVLVYGALAVSTLGLVFGVHHARSVPPQAADSDQGSEGIETTRSPAVPAVVPPELTTPDPLEPAALRVLEGQPASSAPAPAASAATSARGASARNARPRSPTTARPAPRPRREASPNLNQISTVNPYRTQ